MLRTMWLHGTIINHRYIIPYTSSPRSYLLNDACVLLGKPLVSGSALRFEGQVCMCGWVDEWVCPDSGADPPFMFNS